MAHLITDIIRLHTARLLDAGGIEPWTIAARQGDYPRAVQELDLVLSAGKPPFRERLWWILSQLEIKKVPVGVLVSPLEETFEEMKSDAVLHELLIVTLLAFAAAAIQKSQRRLSLLMLDRAFQLIEQSSSFDAEECQAVHGVFLQSLREEIAVVKEQGAALPKKKLDVKQEQLRGLERQLAELEKFKTKPVVTPEPVIEKPVQRKRFTSKSILDDAAKQEREARHAAAVEPQATISTSGPTSRPTSRVAEKRQRLVMAVGCICIMLLIGGFFYWKRDDEFLRHLAMKIEAEGKPELIAPDIRGLDKKSASLVSTAPGSLEDIQSGLEKLSAATKPEPQAEESAPATTERAPQPAVEPAKPQADEPKTEEAHAGDKPVASEKTPLLDPDRFSRTQVEPLGEPYPRNGVVVRGADGRLYGPPPRDSQGGQTLDGNPVRGYEVNRFEPPLMYRTIAETQVLEAPSLVATVVARLDRESKVEVVAEVGHWLEIRSTGGRVGYIYAQDAVPEKEGR